MEILSGVTIAGQTNDEQGKIELLSHWTMEGWDFSENSSALLGPPVPMSAVAHFVTPVYLICSTNHENDITISHESINF